jgi:hypothetical protein
MRLFSRKFLPLILIFLSACASQNPCSPISPDSSVSTFKNDDWAAVLEKVTTADGYVQWDLFQSNSDDVRDKLLKYIGEIGAASPDNRPELFATDADRAAYWINAHNALCMFWVINHDYPATIPQTIPDTFNVGGKQMTESDLSQRASNSDPDPRIFFALNFCAESCPPLRNTQYDGPVLDAQLADQAHVYLRDPRAAVRQGQVVLLSDWILTHKDAFTSAVATAPSQPDAALLSSLRWMATGDSPIAWATDVGKLGFNWSLNRPSR